MYGNLGFVGIMFEGKFRFTRHIVANYFSVDDRTVDKYLSQYSNELVQNGYEVLTGFRLRQFKISYVTDINVGHISEKIENQLVNEKASSLGYSHLKHFKLGNATYGINKSLRAAFFCFKYCD